MDILLNEMSVRRGDAHCTIREGTGAHLLLIGDSHAAMMTPTFRAIADQHDLTLSVSTRLACPWQQDLAVVSFGGEASRRRADCKEQKNDLYDRVIPALDPDVVVAMNRGYEGLPSFVLPNGGGKPAERVPGPRSRDAPEGLR